MNGQWHNHLWFNIRQIIVTTFSILKDKRIANMSLIHSLFCFISSSRFLTILDNLKVKLLQLTLSSVQCSKTAVKHSTVHMSQVQQMKNAVTESEEISFYIIIVEFIQVKACIIKAQPFPPSQGKHCLISLFFILE
jgi:hypothetical protein